ncbi:MAG TPA: NADPH-dependent FMN reductase [Acidimicrobiales bacterium]|nr:NADPH-dependent FMN reductase [Acidimicrobiales bacterium]
MPQTLLLVSGSLRQASASSAILRSAAFVAPDGIECLTYDGLGRLPAFNPDDDRPPLSAQVESLRAAIRRADAILFSTPEYAGALPGSLKNLLDWTIGDDQPGSIYRKPVAWLNVSLRGAQGAHQELRNVLGYAHARIVDAACAHVPVSTAMVGPDGLIADDTARATLAHAVDALAKALIPSQA